MTTGRTRGMHILGAGVLAGALLLGASVGADAATVSAQWQAKLGSGGANGIATLKVFSTGKASLVVTVKGLRASTLYTETLSRGTCAKPGTKLVTFSTVRSTSGGRIARTSSLTAAQAASVNRTGIVIRFTAGTRSVCGAFSKVIADTGGSGGGGGTTPPPPPVLPPLGVIHASVPVGYLPYDVALTPAAVYVALGENTVARIDPVSNSLVSSVDLGDPGKGFPYGIAVGDDGDVWVTVDEEDADGNPTPGNLIRIDATSGQIKSTITVGRFPTEPVACAGSIWVPNYVDGTVTRIDAATGAIAATVTIAPSVFASACGEGSIWFTIESAGAVVRVDPTDNHTIATIRTLALPEGIAVSAGAVWVAIYGREGAADGLVARIDPAKNQVVQTVAVGASPVFLAAGSTSLFVALAGDAAVVQVDLATMGVIGRIPVAGPSAGIAALGTTVWVVQPNTDGLRAQPPQPGTATRIDG